MYHFENLFSTPPFKDSVTNHSKKNLFALLKPGQIAKKVWVLRAGSIGAFAPDDNETVKSLFGPGDIITDFISFLHKVPVVYKYQALSDIEVLELTKENYDKLKLHKETANIGELIMLDEIKRKDKKLTMYLLPARDRIIKFFKEYNISNLPDKYCASFLRLTLEKYIEIKVSLLKSEEITLSPGSKRHQHQTYSMNIASKVKSHIFENYTDPDFGNLNKIAEAFNLTERVVTSHFKKIHHTTVKRLLFQVRMEQALILLSRDKRSAKEVFVEVGYKNVSHFSKRFKIYYGYTTKTARAMDCT